MDLSLDEAIAVLEEVVEFLRQPTTDVVWSKYECVEDAQAEVDAHLTKLRAEDLSTLNDLRLLFAPTGSLQEISLNSGWGVRFLALAARFDRAMEKRTRGPSSGR
ncbi:MAG: hypothetical protein HY040_01425 [Planctomycetes bacterium]|nr:hypothetical protein [Planctomycetota bacterium]